MDPQKQNRFGKMEGAALYHHRGWNHYTWSRKYRRQSLCSHDSYFICKIYAEDDTMPLLSFDSDTFEDIDTEAWRLIGLMEADKVTLSLFVEQHWEAPGSPYRRIMEYQSKNGNAVYFRIILHPFCFSTTMPFCIRNRKN